MTDKVSTSLKVNQVRPWSWMWTASIHGPDLDAEMNGTAWTKKRAIAEAEHWITFCQKEGRP